MRRPGAFLRDQSGAVAEFALVLPLAMMGLLGIIDGGRFMWEVNQAEKATQMGARFAVVTDMVASDLADYSFAIQGGIPQGTVVPISSFERITCTSSGNAVTCACPAGAPCAFGTGADSDAFARIVARMQTVLSSIEQDDVIIDYSWSGLGFSGDPSGPDVAPLVTVRLDGMQFQPATLIVFGGAVNLPAADYSLTLEDGRGTESF